MATGVIGKSMNDTKRLQSIRNIGFIAHIDAGKTTTTERALFYTHRIHKIGEVDQGTTTTDWMVQERSRGITITSASTYCTWKNYQINIIDTPGHVDFTAEVERSLKVLDGCIVILCAQGGVEPQSETVWRQAERYHIPRIIFVNKMDKSGADLFKCEQQIKDKLAAVPLIMQLPIYDEKETFVGIVDLLKEKAIYSVADDDTGAKLEQRDIPSDMQEKVKEYKEKMIDVLSKSDDSILEWFVEGKSVPEAKLIDSIRKATLKRKLTPVFCGSALKKKGVQLLLDAICRYLPSPLDIGKITGLDYDHNSTEVKLQTDEPFCGLCFKVAVDPYVGKLNYVRVYSGKAESGGHLYNVTKEKKERVNKIVRMHANKQETKKEALSGDIICFAGLKHTVTGDTLCAENKKVILEKMQFPEPVISQAVEPKSKADQEKLGFALNKIVEEDPTFKSSYNQETGQTIISGMGQLHLEVIMDRILKEFNVESHIGKPQVAFKETISKKVTTESKFVQQTGGRGQYGHVVLFLESTDKPGVEFQNKIKGGLIPREFIPSVEKGVRQACESGVLGGYPVTKIKVTLINGSYHQVDSSELSFQMAASMAFNDGLRDGKPILLEPIMKLEAVVPVEHLSQVIGDLNSRKAHIVMIRDKSNVKLVDAHIALREVFDYADTLRNLTKGRGTYTMEPAFYQKVPEKIMEKIIGNYYF